MPALLNDFGHHFGALNHGLTDLDGFAIDQQQHFRQLHRVAYFALQFLNAKGIAGFYLILLAAGSNYCIHATPPLYPQLESVKW
jgi:hypothetical protein